MVMPSSAMKRAMSARVNSSAGLPRARTSGFGLREMESVDSAAGEEVGNTADDAKVGSDGMETAPLNRAGEVAEPPRSRARRRRAGGGAAPILLGTPSPVPARQNRGKVTLPQRAASEHPHQPSPGILPIQ